MKWNKENVCASAGCLSKQELGGVLCWPPRARTSQSPSAKQKHTRQLTVGHRRLLLCCAGPWKTYGPPHPPALGPSPGCTVQGKAVKTLRRRRQWQKAEAITSSIWSVWNVAMLYCMWADMFVITAAWSRPGNRSQAVYSMTRRVYDSHCDESFWRSFLCMCQHWLSRRDRITDYRSNMRRCWGLNWWGIFEPQQNAARGTGSVSCFHVPSAYSGHHSTKATRPHPPVLKTPATSGALCSTALL